MRAAIEGSKMLYEGCFKANRSLQIDALFERGV